MWAPSEHAETLWYISISDSSYIFRSCGIVHKSISVQESYFHELNNYYVNAEAGEIHMQLQPTDGKLLSLVFAVPGLYVKVTGNIDVRLLGGMFRSK